MELQREKPSRAKKKKGKRSKPVNAESVNAESVNAEFVNAESVNAEFVNAESVNAEFVNAESVNAESVNTETVPVDESAEGESSSKSFEPKKLNEDLPIENRKMESVDSQQKGNLEAAAADSGLGEKEEIVSNENNDKAQSEQFMEYTIPPGDLSYVINPSAPAPAIDTNSNTAVYDSVYKQALEENSFEINPVKQDIVYPTAPVIENDEIYMNQEVNTDLNESNPLVLEPITDEEIALYYCNPELDGALEGIDTFKQYHLEPRNEFFELLEHYRHCRLAVASIQQQIKSIKSQCKDSASQVWSTLKRDKIGEGKCRDGISVKHRVEFEVAVYSIDRAEELSKALENLRVKFHTDLTRAFFECELAKLDIDLYLDEFFDKSDFLCLVNEKKIMDEISDGKISESSLEKLKLCIDSLFYFERFVCKDKVFKNEIREWLNYSISALLQVARYEEHRYLLNHAVHTRGIGEWGANYIQFPDLISDSVVNHFVAMLYILLKPNELEGEVDSVKSEEEYVVEDDDWIIVEQTPTETKEDCLVLTEDDYISLFEQFPFGRIFAYVLRIENCAFTGQSIHHISGVSSLNVMNLIALAQFLNAALASVFDTVTPKSHPHFLKRVARTVAQIANYVAKHCQAFQERFPHSNDDGNDNIESVSLEKIQHALDHLFLRSCQWFLSAKGLGIWQFLSYFPFEHVSSDMAWKLLLLLFSHDKDVNMDSSVIHVRSFDSWRSFMNKSGK